MAQAKNVVRAETEAGERFLEYSVEKFLSPEYILATKGANEKIVPYLLKFGQDATKALFSKEWDGVTVRELLNKIGHTRKFAYFPHIDKIGAGILKEMLRRSDIKMPGLH